MNPRRLGMLAAALSGLLAGALLHAQASPVPGARTSDYALPGKPEAAPGAQVPVGPSLSISLTYRIVSREHAEPAWTKVLEQTALPGQKVQLKITGEKFVVLSELIPAPAEGSAVRLKALSHIWLARADRGELSYLSSQSTITIKYGEQAIFYPLGSQLESGDVVQIGITINPVKEGK